MRWRSASPLRLAVEDMRESILHTWIHDSLMAYAQAAVLLGQAAETQRLRSVRLGTQHARMLLPAYEMLLDRHGQSIGEGRQLILPWEDHAEKLREAWSDLAVSFVREPGRAQVQRWVLQASVGLAGRVDTQTALGLLVAAAAEACL